MVTQGAKDVGSRGDFNLVVETINSGDSLFLDVGGDERGCPKVPLHELSWRA